MSNVKQIDYECLIISQQDVFLLLKFWVYGKLELDNVTVLLPFLLVNTSMLFPLLLFDASIA